MAIRLGAAFSLPKSFKTDLPTAGNAVKGRMSTGPQGPDYGGEKRKGGGLSTACSVLDFGFGAPRFAGNNGISAADENAETKCGSENGSDDDASSLCGTSSGGGESEAGTLGLLATLKGMMQKLLALIGLQSVLQGMAGNSGNTANAGTTTQCTDGGAGCTGSAPALAGEKDTSVRPTEQNLTGRPPGDNRSAEQIINDNPVLKNLGNQKDIKQAELKARFGDWTAANKDPQSRADAAYNMARILNSVKALKNREGGDRTEISQNGKIEGITKSGDARHGTEAGVLKDIAEQGLSALPTNGRLPETKDTHVRLDGTNKDNFQWAMGRIGNFLSKIPILRSIAAPFFNRIGEARTLGQVFTGGLTGLAEGAMSVSRGPVGWAVTAATDTVGIAVDSAKKSKDG
ncbi:hypothetical protein [Sodalis sp. dw_96]|uniref:hypothetical protein n=1 Tax=Sodalis sp. dw_96 TaxID=2719794 RepID=UPI0021039ED5|nr:hypothetical protein [Sodalis sp. dw_96]